MHMKRKKHTDRLRKFHYRWVDGFIYRLEAQTNIQTSLTRLQTLKAAQGQLKNI